MATTAIALTAALGALASTAAAAPAPGTWQRVAAGDLTATEQIGFARTADGTLHVAWHRQTGPNAYDLVHTAISPSGRVGASSTIVSGWTLVGDPALVAVPGGIAVLFPGFETDDTGGPRNGLDLARSADGGASWTVAPAAVYVNDFAAGRTPAAAVTKAGTLLQTWYGTTETLVHAGLDPQTPARGGYGTGANQNLASGGGSTVVAWCADKAPYGIYAHTVDPGSGAPVGAAARLPDRSPTGTFRSCPAAGRTPLVARRGGGFFVATTDPAEKTVFVWRVGAGKAAAVARGGSTQSVALAGAPDGRLWVGWEQDETLYVRRSNRAGTVWGAAVSVHAPKGQFVYHLDLVSAPDGGVDALVRSKTVDNAVSVYQTRLRPGLTLQAKGGKVVSFRVTDAGDPVAGARIRVAGRTLKADKQGRASADLSQGRFKAVASKPGYVSAAARVRSS
jgi:hypothetical protein